MRKALNSSKLLKSKWLLNYCSWVIFLYIYIPLLIFPLLITAIKITPAVVVDKVTGLSTTTSDLEYTAVKGDIDASFTCQVQHIRSANMDSSPLTFTVNCKYTAFLFILIAFG